MRTKMVLAALFFALFSLACNFSVFPPKPLTPQPVRTEAVLIPKPDARDVRLRISFGGGKLKLVPGGDALVEGVATYSYPYIKPVIDVDGADVHLRTGDVEFGVLPTLDKFENTWDLDLGRMPMSLAIYAGAYQGEYELGGLALQSLTIKDGAANVSLAFSEPNQVEMSTFQYKTGASEVQLSGLANANFTFFDFTSGAGDYKLDFSGRLQRDASAKISSGFSNLMLQIPRGVNAVVTVNSSAANVSAGSVWNRVGNVYKQEAGGPTLTCIIEIGAGNLTLTE